MVLKMNADNSQYYLVAFSVSDAFVVDVTQGSKAYHIDYKTLRIKYINLDEEAKQFVKKRRDAVDPRGLLDETIPLEQLLSRQEFQGGDQEELSALIQFFRETMTTKEKQEKIAQFAQDKQKTDDQLYKEILADLTVQKEKPFSLVSFSPVKAMEARYIMGMRGFAALEDAQKALYTAWQTVRADAGMIAGANGKTYSSATIAEIRALVFGEES